MDVRYTEASLKTIAQSQLLRDLARLSLPEIEAARKNFEMKHL